jgi:hypothetical protein
VSYPIGAGPRVTVEIDDGSGPTPVSRSGDRIRDLGIDFTEHLESVRAAAREVLNSFRDDLGPDEVKLTMGIKLTAEAGAVIAKTGTEGNFVLELTWKPEAGRGGDDNARQ